MANTKVTQNVLQGSTERVVMFTLVSDGSQETNAVVYNASAAGFVPSTSVNSRIMAISWSMSSGSTAGVLATARLLYDATTKIVAWSIPANNAGHIDFHDVGGLNLGQMGASGATGNILLTTLGLIVGDSLSLVLHIKAS